jgi:lysophospholipase L1-like esterase
VYAPADTDYKANLTKMIEEVRAKQAHPILATSIYRAHFDDAGKVKSTHGAYPQAMRDLAKELAVPLVDLQEATGADLGKWGEETAKPYFLFHEPGEIPAYPEGKKDRTHLSEKGGIWVATLFAQGLRAQKSPLAEWLKPEAP